MSEKPKLHIDWATHKAAKYACENWHYSGCMPAGKLVKFGVWEDGKFIGVVLYSRGSNPRMALSYGLKQTQCCELTRIALRRHKTPVSRMVALTLKLLKKLSTGMRLVVSYADPVQGHYGGIYQASNWVYTGKSKAQCELVINGASTHKRSANARYGTASQEKLRRITGKSVHWSEKQWKHVYLMPLDEAMHKQIKPLEKPYPKCAPSADSGTSDNQSGGGGAIPTGALQNTEGQDA